MFLETLERMRPRNAPSASRDTIDEVEVGARNSTRSSTSSSPSSRSTKRYSNNLFGSGRLRDYTYLKNVTSSRGSASSSSRTVSLTPTEASEKTLSFRPVTPDGSNPSSSVQSSPNEKTSPIRSAPLVPSTPSGEQQLQAITVAEYRLQKTLGPSVLRRASLALDEAIREIEDEVEDEILLPRSVPIPHGGLEQSSAEVVRPYLHFLTVRIFLTRKPYFVGCRGIVRHQVPHLYLKVAWPYRLIKLSTTNSVTAEHPPLQHARSQVTFLECPDP